MNVTKTKFWYLIPAIVIAFTIGYVLNLLHGIETIADVRIGWLLAANMALAVLSAYLFGTSQRSSRLDHGGAVGDAAAEKRRQFCLRIAAVAHKALASLENRYRNTYDDRMDLRRVYHGDTFAATIDALSSIPVHELESAEAVVALMGLRKNMLEVQAALGAILAEDVQWVDDAVSPHAIKAVDLARNKAQAEAHYDHFVRAVRRP